MTLESLLKDKDLTTTIKDLVRGSGRSSPLSEVEMKAGQYTAAVIPEKIVGDQVKIPVATQLNGSSKEGLGVM